MPEGTPLTTNKDEEPTFLSTLMADGLRRRKFSPSVSNNGNGPVFDKTSIPTRNVVNTAPTKGILQNWNTFRTKIGLIFAVCMILYSQNMALIVISLILDLQLRLHTMSTVSQKMVIKLSINAEPKSGDQNSDEEGLSPENDIELCVLKYGNNGVLEITPDFTHNRRPYTVEVCYEKETFT